MHQPNLMATRPTLVVLKHFYKLKAAEHELVIRISAAAEELGWDVRVFNLDSTTRVNEVYEFEKNASLILDIHYEYPKFMIPNSIGAFWTPTSFMKEWDLAYVWENQLSHDTLVYPDSPQILKLLKLFRQEDSFQILNHSVPGSWLNWISEKDRNPVLKAFYAGINWNKLSGRPGRHNKLFELLDSTDTLAIYGPEKIEHIRPWAGFKNYQGQIPFDGKSLFTIARSHGVSLVLSAEQHKAEGIMSSRLFEGLAAGNVIISDDHPFTKRHLGSNAYYLELEKGDDYAARQLNDIVLQLREEPSRTKQLQQLSQEIFRSKFDLTTQLKSILVVPKIQHAVNDIHVIVQGNSQNNIRQRLNDLGYSEIYFTRAKLKDMAEIIELGRSLDYKKFLIVNANTEFLDSFTHRLNLMLEKLELNKSPIGVLSTVSLKHLSSTFAPGIIGSKQVLPLNGIVVNTNYLTSHEDALVDIVPVLRVINASKINFVSSFRSTYEILETIGNSFLNHGKSEKSGSRQIRYIVNNELEEKQYQTSGDLTEEVRQLSRGRKQLLILFLFSSIPIARPFVYLYKRIRRNFGN